MSKMYYVSMRTIEQAERMRDKYSFILEEKENKLYFQTEIKLTQNEILNIEKAIVMCKEKINEISEALSNISGYNKLPWKHIVVLREAAAMRDVLDDEINSKRNFK